MITSKALMDSSAPENGTRYDFPDAGAAIDAASMITSAFDENIYDVHFERDGEVRYTYRVCSVDNKSAPPGSEMMSYSIYFSPDKPPHMICNYGTSNSQETFRFVAEASIAHHGGVQAKTSIISKAQMAANAPGSAKRYDFGSADMAHQACALMSHILSNLQVPYEVMLEQGEDVDGTFTYRVFGPDKPQKTSGSEAMKFTLKVDGENSAHMICNFGTGFTKKLFQDMADDVIARHGGVASKQVGE